MGLFSKAKKVNVEKVALVTELLKLAQQLIARDADNFYGLTVHALSNDYDPVIFKNASKVLVKLQYCGSSIPWEWQQEGYAAYEVFKATFKMFNEEDGNHSFCFNVDFNDEDDVTAILNAALQNAGFDSIDEKQYRLSKSFYQKL